MVHASPAKTRPTGAEAQMGRTGFPRVTSATGGVVDIRTGVSEEGFNPLDLLYASLSACLAMSARIAASKLGVMDRFESVTAHVTGEKAADEPSRIARLVVTLDIRGDFDHEMRERIASLTETVCTVSNTLFNTPDMTVTVSGG